MKYYKFIWGSTMDGRFNYRIELIEYAKKNGLRSAAKAFEVSRTTVQKWVERYEALGLDGLRDQSRAPHRQWKKCEPAFEAEVTRLRKRTKNKLGAVRLIDRFNLKRSEHCINRIIQENPELRRKKKTKTDKRNDLWSVKKLMKAFEVIQVDVKELMDISNYYVQQWRNPELPKYEITARDVKTGATWICLADSKEATRTAAFVSMLLQHLKVHGFDVSKIGIQTDNGTEFHNLKLDQGQSNMEKVLEHFGASSLRIPPAAPTFNSDVETFHRLVEDEFYSIERFKDAEDMRQQEYTYMLDFNYLRKNSNKDNKTPLELLREDYPHCDEGVLNFPLVNIKDYTHFYTDLFQQPVSESDHDPLDFFAFHGFDLDDATVVHHVSKFHKISSNSVKLFEFPYDILCESNQFIRKDKLCFTKLLAWGVC